MSRATARRLALDDQPLLPIGDVATPVTPVVPITHKVPVRAHRRTIGAPPPLTGRQRRDAALDTLATREATQGAVAYVRAQLLALYRSRGATDRDAYVTADDIETVLRDWPDCPKEAQPAHGPQFWRGTVFRKGWRQTGKSVPSDRPHLHATAMPCWVPTDSTLNQTNP